MPVLRGVWRPAEHRQSSAISTRKLAEPRKRRPFPRGRAPSGRSAHQRGGGSWRRSWLLKSGYLQQRFLAPLAGRGAGGSGSSAYKKKPAAAGTPNKKTPPLRPSLADGVNGGVFRGSGEDRFFQGARPCARHLSAAGVPQRERSGRLARQVQQGRGQRPLP